MKKALIVLMAGVCLVSIGACSNYYAAVNKSLNKPPKKIFKFHGETNDAKSKAPAKSVFDVFRMFKNGVPATSHKQPTQPIVAALKMNTLTAYPNVKIGDAFEGYRKNVTSSEWKETVGFDENFYVDFICWFETDALLNKFKDNSVVKSGLDVKFVIHKDGATAIAMVSKLQMMSNGTIIPIVLPFPEHKKIVEGIYNKQTISF